MSTVTVRMRGVTMWRQARGLAALAGVAAVALVAAGCQVTTHVAAAVGSLTASSSASAVATSAQRSGAAGPIVALGDSYTAGALLPIDMQATPVGCLRSDKAYPVLVAQALHAQLTDVACTSAEVKQLTTAQKTYLGSNPPQLDALAPDDKLVMMTLGGDNLGFIATLQECMKLSATDSSGSPCEAHYTAGGTNQLADAVKAVAPQISQALAEIRARAPHARILVVGYPDLFPQSGDCWPRVPLTAGDIAYLRGIELSLNAMLAAAAAAAGDTFVNTYTPTIGHDFCQPESNRDVEGLIPASLALPFHPNAKGQQAMATAVLAALKS